MVEDFRVSESVFDLATRTVQKEEKKLGCLCSLRHCGANKRYQRACFTVEVETHSLVDFRVRCVIHCISLKKYARTGEKIFSNAILRSRCSDVSFAISE